MRNAAFIVIAAASLGGCYSEGLAISDLRGRVTIPKELVTQQLVNPQTGAVEPVTDVALIGPVYVGLYPSVAADRAAYPLPEVGADGSATPYGGTTMGDFRYACFEFFQCRLLSNRFVTYDDILDFYKNTIGDPVLDAAGHEVETGEFFRQTCFDLLEVSSDWEIRLLPEDRNEDGVIDEQDLDFHDDGNGNFVGDFLLPQAEFFPGMTAWAWMDAPAFFETQDDLGNSYQRMDDFRTCNPTNGYFENNYDLRFQAGLVRQNVLNDPGEYLSDGGDVVATEGYIWEDPGNVAEIRLDARIGPGGVLQPATGGQ